MLKPKCMITFSNETSRSNRDYLLVRKAVYLLSILQEYRGIFLLFLFLLYLPRLSQSWLLHPKVNTFSGV